MSGYQKQYSYLPLAELIEALKHDGFNIGVEHYLDAKRLLLTVDFDNHSQREDLKWALCALFATNAEEQAIFTRHFDRFFDPQGNWKRWQLNTQAPLAPPPNWTPPKETSPWLFILIGVMTLLIITAGVILFKFYQEDQTPQPVATQRVVPPQNQPPPLAVDSTQNTAPPPVPAIIDPVPLEAQPFHDPDVTHLEVTNPFWNEYGFYVRWWLLLVLLAGFGLYELYLFRRNRMIVQRQKDREPPVAWQLKVDDQVKVNWGDGYHQLKQQMRKRVKSGEPQLDIHATALATARNAGQLTVAFSQKTKPSEFLVLVDRDANRNQQVALFEHIMASLQKADIHLQIFEYDKSPQKFTDPRSGKQVGIGHLLYHYADHRLILFSSGVGLIHPGRNELFDWAEAFANFPFRALFTHVPVASWGTTENALSQLFTVLPASAEGMAELSDYLDRGFATEHFHIYHQYYKQEEIYDPSTLAGDLRINLRQYCGRTYEPTADSTPDLYDWLLACAVYHELFWDLTLHVGKTLSPALLTQENLQKLTALQWFRDGKLPDHIREILLDDADLQPTPHHQKAIKAVQHVLQQSAPADKVSISYDEHRMHMVVSELMLKPSERKRKKLMQELKLLRDTTKSNDYAVLRYLKDVKHTPFDILVPSRLKNRIFKDGLPYRGYKGVVRLAAFLFVIVIPVLLLDLSYDESTRYNFTYNSKRYCTDSGLTTATFAMHQAAFHNNSKPLDSNNETVERLLAEANAVAPDYHVGLINNFYRKYNLGLNMYQQSRFDEAAEIWQKNRNAGINTQITIQKQKEHYEGVLDSLAQLSGQEETRLYQEASRELESLNTLQPEFEKVYQHNLHGLAVAYLVRQEHDKAWQIYQLIDQSYLDDFGSQSVRTLFQLGN